MKRIIALMLALALLLALTGCKSKDEPKDSSQLSFSSAVDFNAIQKLNGKSVTITGYMSTLSPVSGKFMYLMNLPYQSCPFCLPNTSQLSNTMAVYAPEGETFGFTDQPIRVTGVIDVNDYTDEFGYEYNYRIVNAKYEAVDLSAVSADYALWQAAAAEGIVADVYAMFDYLYFLCQWTQYTGTSVLDDGTRHQWNMYPEAVKMFLEDTGPYGYAKQSSDDYFPGLTARVVAISATELKDLEKVLLNAHALAIYAKRELLAQNYTYDPESDSYTLNNDAELQNRYRQVYLEFDNWLTRWQM